ncbi:hypothetical protein IEO21_08170 [Rhodonia placenta]|uniref:Uncharacterized protein n=1 Tax=Rhodonia placenta TaxID=104341 RepID=A0A8H7NWT6_9APHY|nr:hypothetical protein IEO21_08170 [Postia placenta]
MPSRSCGALRLREGVQQEAIVLQRGHAHRESRPKPLEVASRLLHTRRHQPCEHTDRRRHATGRSHRLGVCRLDARILGLHDCSLYEISNGQGVV